VPLPITVDPRRVEAMHLKQNSLVPSHRLVVFIHLDESHEPSNSSPCDDPRVRGPSQPIINGMLDTYEVMQAPKQASFFSAGQPHKSAYLLEAMRTRENNVTNWNCDSESQLKLGRSSRKACRQTTRRIGEKAAINDDARPGGQSLTSAIVTRKRHD
jgi:hypothetical protein